MLCSHQIKLTYGRRLLRLHQHPASGRWGLGGLDHSFGRLLRPAVISVRPPGSGRTDQVLADGDRSSPAPPSSRPPRLTFVLFTDTGGNVGGATSVAVQAR